MSNINDLEAVARLVLKATVPEDVFGDIRGDKDVMTRAVRQIYRKTMVLVHPDRFPDPDKLTAGECVRVLGEWRTSAEIKIAAGTYGDRKPVVPVVVQPSMEPQVVKTPKGQYVVESLIAHGDLADVYRCNSIKAGVRQDFAFKVVQSAADNDLLKHEATVLEALYPKDQPEEKFYRFLPKMHDSFMLRGSKARTNRHVNILPLYTDLVTLEDVSKAYPGGLDFRDMVWMFKRLLMALGFSHRQGVIHGAVLPPHVLVHPVEHGAKLVDWCYAVSGYYEGPSYVKAMSTPWRDFYAPEILAKSPVSSQTDIYMAAQCMVYLLGGDVKSHKMSNTIPHQIRVFLGSCLFPSQGRRPDDAWALLEEFDQMLEKLVGKPAYRRLVMPAK